MSTPLTHLLTESPTKLSYQPAAANVLDSCDDGSAAALSALILINKQYNESNISDSTMTAKNLSSYLNKCQYECSFKVDMDDNAIINYNESIPIYCCGKTEQQIIAINITLKSGNFTTCIDEEIDDNTTSTIEDILIWFKDIHHYFEFLVPDFIVFLSISVIMCLLFVLSFLNWIHSKGSYCLCCWCHICGCMAADQANLTILFIISLRIGDIITDTLATSNMVHYYFK